MCLLFLSKYLTYAIICGSLIHNGGGRAVPLCIYPKKYLNEPLLPYDSFLATLFFKCLLHQY